MGQPTFSRLRQRFVANYGLRSSPLAPTAGVLQEVLGGWNVSGVTVLQGGSPMTIADQTAGHAFRYPAAPARPASDASTNWLPACPMPTSSLLVGSNSGQGGTISGGPVWFNKGCVRRAARDVVRPEPFITPSPGSDSGQAQCAAANPGISVRDACTATAASGIINGLASSALRYFGLEDDPDF